jgi:hypothetical protein
MLVPNNNCVTEKRQTFSQIINLQFSDRVFFKVVIIAITIAHFEIN